MSIERSPTFEYGLNLMNGFQRRFRDETSHPWAIILIAPFIIAHHTFDPQWSWQKKCLFFLCYIPAIIVAYMLELLAYYIFFFIAPFRVIYSFVLITFETIDVLSKFLLDHVGGGIVLALTGSTILCTQCFGAHHVFSLQASAPWLWLTVLGIVCVVVSHIPNYYASRHFGEAYQNLNNGGLWLTSGIHALTIALLLGGIIPLLTLPLSPWTMYGMGMLVCISPLLIKTITFLATKPDDQSLYNHAVMSQFMQHKITTACASLGVIALLGALTPLQLGSGALMCTTYVLILFGMLCFGTGLLVFTAKRASINHLLRITMGNIVLCGISIGCCFPMFHTLSTSVIGIVFLSLLPLLLLLLPIALEKTLPKPLILKAKQHIKRLKNRVNLHYKSYYNKFKNSLPIKAYMLHRPPETPIYVNQQWYDFQLLKKWWKNKSNYSPHINNNAQPSEIGKIEVENRLCMTYLAFAYLRENFIVVNEEKQDDEEAKEVNDPGIAKVKECLENYDQGIIDKDFAAFIQQKMHDNAQNRKLPDDKIQTNDDTQYIKLPDNIKKTLTTLIDETIDKTKEHIRDFYTTLKNSLSIKSAISHEPLETPIYILKKWYDLEPLKKWWCINDRKKDGVNPMTNLKFSESSIAKINAKDRLAVTYLAFAYHKNCFKVLDESKQEDEKALKANDPGIKQVEKLFKQYDRGQIDPGFADFILQIEP